MKVQFNLPSLFKKINTTTYQRYGIGAMHIEEISRGVNAGALLVMFPPTGYGRDVLGNLESWGLNFAAWCRPYRGLMFAHKGFWEIYQDLHETLWSSIEDYCERCAEKERDPKIVLTGYSQGAAIATIAHEDLFFHSMDVCGIVFASPRVFVNAPSSRFKNLHRIEVRGDLITRIPWLPYKHVGRRCDVGARCWPYRIEKHFQGEYLEQLEGLNFDEARGKGGK